MKNKYQVIASFARRRQYEAAKVEIETRYPTGWWWLTGSNVWEFRIPVPAAI